MSRSVLLARGGDVVSYVADLIGGSGHPPDRSLVIFPSRRPLVFLARELARRAGRALPSPSMHAIDDWVATAAPTLGHDGRLIEAADGAALIYQLHDDCRLPGDDDRSLSMEEFLAWGFKLFADFEELAIEGVTASALRGVQALAQEPLPGAFGRQLAHLSEWYEGFYRALDAQHLATRSSGYVHVAAHIGELDLSQYAQVILAGFFMLSDAERRIVELLLARPDSTLVLRDGPGIERTIKKLGIEPVRDGQERPTPAVSFLQANDSHGQVMAVNGVIRPGCDLSDTVLVLPLPETVFPVIHHVLSRLDGGWNISTGYPLLRTPLWGLLRALAAACETREGDSYFLADYLRLMLHPYVKNIALGGASYPTRILLHAIEEALGRRGQRLVSLDMIERDPELREKLAAKLSGLIEQGVSAEDLFGHLTRLHGLVLRPFENVASVADFAGKLLALVSAISEHGTANEHPYAARFFQQMLATLESMRDSLLARQRFEDVRTYFGLLERFVSPVKVTFPGTPLAGLQVLGFWETRNLVFGTVVVLDANEGTLPGGGSVDTVLPQALRVQLGLPTARDRELIDQYHFENLLAGSAKAVLCHSQCGGAQRSRFIERLVWREELRQGVLGAASQRPVHFRAAFTQQDPGPIAKTPAMMEVVGRLPFSATMLDTYLRCGLRFCYKYLVQVQEKDEAAVDVDASEIGTVVHRILKAFFDTKKGGVFRCGKSDGGRMRSLVDEMFARSFGADQDGGVYLIKAQVQARMDQLLDHHRGLPAFTVLECEEKYEPTVDLPGLGMVPLAGKLDRVDQRGGRIVIIDYKTGQGKAPSYRMFAGSAREEWPRALRSVQLPFYVMLYRALHGDADPGGIDSELMLLGGQSIEQAPLFPEGADRDAVFAAYRRAIITLIGEIRDPSLPFADTWDPGKECGGCPYQVLCGRQWVAGR
ncbi:MAG: PD-(D/E)XK nuclease family protein [Candidatus Edwardsbacteria bacterium]|jgi:hypothetical protein|nr:PD-(D/E)XK nuclease family protein [Candidatus Edwardsbacteria bacterium]